MEYASISNHLLNFGRYAFAFVLVFGVFPYFIFAKQYNDRFENIVSRFIKMTFLIIIIGYGLIITKLFEFLGILFFLAIAFTCAALRRHGLPELSRLKSSSTALIYNVADGIIHPKELFLGFLNPLKLKLGGAFKSAFKYFLNPLQFILTAFTFIYAGYLRLNDVFFHAAPALSDGTVTLLWLKYVQNRLFFPEGIYPQGFHICLAIVQKFSGADPLYILKYWGPVNGVLIAAGLYFAVSRIAKRKGPGIIAAFIYGGLGQFLTASWDRQGATNSQEFAFVFIIPVLYFFIIYLEELDKKYLYTAFAGITVTGLVHTLAFAFAAYGVVIIMFAALLSDIKKYYRVFMRVFIMGVVSGIISVLPIGLGLLMGCGFNSSSEDFLFSQSADAAVPELIVSDYAAIISLALLLLYLLFTFIFSFKKRKEKMAVSCFTWFGIFSFLLYYLGGYLSKSEVLDARARDLWSLVSPLCIGLGVYVLGQIVRAMTAKRILDFVLCSALVVSAFVYFKPTAVFPYKMMYDKNVEQYLKIVQAYRPTEWRIVGQTELFGLAYNIGFIEYVYNFLNDNIPEARNISYVLDGKRIEVKDKDVFIFLEKKIFRTDFPNYHDEYDRREEEKYVLEDWLERYTKTHDNISVFYEDGDITVYHIHQEPTREDVMDKIW